MDHSYHPLICVLLENYYPSIGGVETQTRSIIKSLLSKKIRFIVITRRYSRSISKVEQVDGVTIFRIPPLGINSTFKKWKMIFPAFIYLMKLRNEYDIIFVPGFNALGIPASLAAKIFGKKCVFLAPNPGELSEERSLLALKKTSLFLSILFIKLVLPLKKRFLLRADRFIAITKELEEDFLSNKVESEKIVRIPNGVDVNIYHPVSLEDKLKIRQKLSIPVDKIIVMFVGRLVKWKGVPLLVKAWPMVIRDCPEAHLYIVGPGNANMDGCEDELKEIISSLGISKSVTFTGGVNNGPEYFNAADIFTSPAEYEAFGITVIEAMSSGLPVVVTSVGGMKETVRNNEHGLSIPVNDLECLHTSLVTLIRDISLRQKMGAASRVWVEQKFSLDAIAEKYLHLFRSLI